MTGTKRHILRRIALGLAVAAIVPATAQARPMDLSGTDSRAIHAQSVDGTAVVGAEDLAFSRQAESTPTVATADGNSGYDAGVGSVAGLVLILAAAGAAVAVHNSRKAKLSPA